MKKELTFFELIRLIAALAVAVAIFFAASEYTTSIAPEPVGLGSFFVYALVAIMIPPFVAILLATILPSWRYRTIAATLMLMLATLVAVADVLLSLQGFMDFVIGLIRLSAAMTGALGAVFIWQLLKKGHQQRASPQAVEVQPATKMPKTSKILLGLSYLSIPGTYVTIFVSAFLVVGYSALLLLGLLQLPRIPVVAIAAAVLAPLVAGWAALRALGAIFRSRPPFQPSLVMNPETHPETVRLIDDVCAAVKTKQPDNILIHAEPTFFVTQQKMKTFDGPIRGRTLALGMPLLPHLDSQEFKSILAHEFAHFSGSDTRYSIWVAQVHRELGESIGQVRQGVGGDGCLSTLMSILLVPSLLFLSIFYEFFASIDAILSRSRELRADWIAVDSCGTDAFCSALQKVVQYGAHFGSHQKELNSGEEANIFLAHKTLLQEDPAKLVGYLDEAMEQTEQTFDSHPSLRTRLGSMPEHTAPVVEEGTAFQAEFEEDSVRLAEALGALRRQFERFMQQGAIAQPETAG